LAAARLGQIKQDVVRPFLKHLGVFRHVPRPSRADDRIPNVCEINRKFAMRKRGTLRFRKLHLNLWRKCRKVYSSRGDGSVTVLVGVGGKWFVSANLGVGQPSLESRDRHPHVADIFGFVRLDTHDCLDIVLVAETYDFYGAFLGTNPHHSRTFCGSKFRHAVLGMLSVGAATKPHRLTV
jgi:hypothetical protein